MPQVTAVGTARGVASRATGVRPINQAPLKTAESASTSRAPGNVRPQAAMIVVMKRAIDDAKARGVKDRTSLYAEAQQAKARYLAHHKGA